MLILLASLRRKTKRDILRYLFLLYFGADKSAKAVFSDGLQDLRSMCQIVRDTFDKSVSDFRAQQESSEGKDGI